MSRSARILALGATALAVRARQEARKATGADEAQRAAEIAGRASAAAVAGSASADESAKCADASAMSAFVAGKRAELAEESIKTSAERAERAAKATSLATDLARAAENRANDAERGVAAVVKTAEGLLKAARLAQRAAENAEGPMGPMPRHQWNSDIAGDVSWTNGTRIRFEIQPDVWGPWSEDLRGKAGKHVTRVVGVGGGSSSRTERARITSSDTPYSVPDNISTVFVNAAGGAITVTIPAARTAALRVKKTDSSANAVTVEATGGTVEGLASLALGSQHDAVDLEPNLTDWELTS